VLQGYAAVAAVSRCAMRHHALSVDASDVILLARPDVVYSAAVDFHRLARLSRIAVLVHSPLLLLLRHGGTQGLRGINWNDPSDVAWVASRAAYDALCPRGSPCLGARTVEQLREKSHGGCGHPYVHLLVHAAGRLGLGVFFADVGWRISLHRTHGDCSRGYNGGVEVVSANTSYLGTRRDLTAGLLCAVGHNEHNESACVRGIGATSRTIWGPANLSSGFNYGARYFVCAEPLVSPVNAFAHATTGSWILAAGV
jgi:hypothetical protein